MLQRGKNTDGLQTDVWEDVIRDDIRLQFSHKWRSKPDGKVLKGIRKNNKNAGTTEGKGLQQTKGDRKDSISHKVAEMCQFVYNISEVMDNNTTTETTWPGTYGCWHEIPLPNN